MPHDRGEGDGSPGASSTGDRRGPGQTGRGQGQIARLQSQALARAHLLPDFLVLGSGRGGVSRLLALLETHPGVLPGPGETRFFDSERYSWGVPWYRLQFETSLARRRARASGQARVVTGESSSTYLVHPVAAARAARTVPDARLIVVLREPTSRAVAHWAQRVQQGLEDRSFREVVEAELGTRSASGGLRVPRQRRLDDPLVVRRGVYLPQLERWLTHFSRERMLVVSSGQLWGEPREVLAEACGLLALPVASPGTLVPDGDEGLRADTGSLRGPQGGSDAGPEPDEETVSRLRDFYRSQDADLARALGVVLDWTSAPGPEA